MTSSATIPAFANGWQQATRYPDPAIVALDPRFEKYWLKLSCVERLYTGCRWAEGPVYFGDGRYLLWSDIPNNRILKWEEETGTVSVYRKPSNFANGHTRDREGSLVSCSHGNRHVERAEHDGSITVLADRYDGKRLNSPNDMVVRSDGTIWFTDPSFGIGDYEGNKAEPEGPMLRLPLRSGVGRSRRSPSRSCSDPTASPSRPTRRSSTLSRAAACRTARSSPTTSPTAAANSPTGAS